MRRNSLRKSIAFVGAGLFIIGVLVSIFIPARFYLVSFLPFLGWMVYWE